MESGLRLTERYRLVDRLDDDDGFDDDGSLEVWRARDELLDRSVAVKLLTPGRPDLHKAFQKGVNGAAGLAHAAVETVYDSDQTRDGQGRLASYVVTEHLDGIPLAERTGPASLRVLEAVDICAQIADALAAAHTVGVIHGDLRPEKVLLVRGEVKVVDFGIGALVAAEPPHDRVRAQSPCAQTRAADVRALGVILGRCLAAAPVEETDHLGLASLIERCGLDDSALRPSAEEAADVLLVAAESLERPLADDVPALALPVRRVDAERPGSAGHGAKAYGAHGHGAEGYSAAGYRAEGHGIPHGRWNGGGAERPEGEGKPDDRRSPYGKILRTAAIAVPVAAATAILVSSLLSSPPGSSGAPMSGAAPAGTAQVPSATAPADPTLSSVPSAPQETPLPDPGVDQPTVPAGPPPSRSGVTNALGRLRPLVSSGAASGEIRSDVAVDLNNVINNLENDLTQDRNLDLTERIASLQHKITTRLRERGLSPELAARLTNILSTISA